MIAAEITMVLEKRSIIRVSASSRAIARLISPLYHHRLVASHLLLLLQSSLQGAVSHSFDTAASATFFLSTLLFALPGRTTPLLRPCQSLLSDLPSVFFIPPRPLHPADNRPCTSLDSSRSRPPRIGPAIEPVAIHSESLPAGPPPLIPFPPAPVRFQLSTGACSRTVHDNETHSPLHACHSSSVQPVNTSGRLLRIVT